MVVKRSPSRFLAIGEAELDAMMPRRGDSPKKRTDIGETAPRRILLLSRGGQTGGSQRQLFYVAANLDRSRYEPVVVCREQGPFVDLLRDSGIETHVLPLTPWRKWPAALHRYPDRWNLSALARRCRACLIHSSDLWLTGYLLSTARRLDVPSVAHVRKPVEPREVRKHRCGRARALIAISNRVRDDLLRAGVAPQKVSVIYDGVDLEEFHPDRGRDNVLRREFPGCRGVLVGIIGRIDRFKRQMDFLRSAVRVGRAARRKVTFFVVGDAHEPAYHQELVGFARASRLDGQMVFTGRREDIAAVLASLDILVTLSGGSVMVEAMACGTPVISAGFTQPAQSTIVLHERNGLLVPSGRDGDLDAALVRLIEDDALRTRLGHQARRSAEKAFGHDALVLATQGLYDRLLTAR